MEESATVDIKGSENLVDGLHVEAGFDGPKDYVNVFLARLELIQNLIDQGTMRVKLGLQQSEIAAVQFDPEAFSLQMFDPASSEIPLPVFSYPASYTTLT